MSAVRGFIVIQFFPEDIIFVIGSDDLVQLKSLL